MAKDVKIKVSGDTSKYERSMRSVKLSTRKMTQGVEKSWTSAAKKIGGALGLITAGYGIKSLATSFLDAAKTTENYQVRLQVLLGSVEEGNRLFKDMADYAGRVPFEYQKIMGAATQLSGVMKGGVSEIQQWMPLIGDLAAAAGLGIEKTTEQVIRMYSAGAASADLFRERGILAMLGFKAGVSYSVEDTRRIMFESWNKTGSQFKDATGKLSKTWTGMMSMINDKWFQFRQMIMEAGVFDELKKGLEDVNKQFGQWIKNNEQIIKQKIPEYIRKTKDSIKSIVDIYNALPAGLISATGYGLVGGLLFGGQAGVIIGAIALLNTQLKSLNLNLGSLADKYRDLGKATGNIWDAITGKKDWRTGQEIGPLGGPIFRGKMPPRPEAAPGVPGGGAGGAGQPEPWEHAKSIAEQVASSWNEVMYKSQILGLSYFFRRDQALLEEARQQELERLRVFGEQRIELNQWEHDAAIHMMQARQTEELRIEEYSAKAKIQAQMNYMTATMNIGRAIQAFSGKQSKVIFGIMKGVEVAKATMAAFSASALALANPPGPPWTIPLSKAVLMMGLANAAAIAATSIGQMIGAGGASMGAISTGAVPSAPVPYASPDVALSREARPTTNIYIQGDFVGEESWIDYLIEKLNQAGEDRDVYVYASHAGTAESLA